MRCEEITEGMALRARVTYGTCLIENHIYVVKKGVRGELCFECGCGDGITIDIEVHVQGDGNMTPWWNESLEIGRGPW